MREDEPHGDGEADGDHDEPGPQRVQRSGDRLEPWRRWSDDTSPPGVEGPEDQRPVRVGGDEPGEHGRECQHGDRGDRAAPNMDQQVAVPPRPVHRARIALVGSRAVRAIERIEAFCRWMEDATCTRREPWRFGTALFNDDYPGRYDSNFLRVERPLGSASAAEIAADADRLYEAFGHREVVVPDDVDGERLAAGFGELGWQVDHLLYMVRRRTPDRPGEVEVRDAPVDDALVFRREVWRRANGEASVPIAEFVRVLADRAGGRFFLADRDGTAVAGCELYLHDGVAQIEDVNTLEEARGLGLARAVVLAAADDARGRGADLVFLIADAADWPKELYVKLGFDPIGAFWQFTRVPAG